MEKLTIVCSNAGKSFQKQWLFKDFNYQFNTDNSYAILGLNGSGKSSLTLILCAQLSLTEGSIARKLGATNISEIGFYKYYSLVSPALELIEELTLSEWIEYYKKLKNVDLTINDVFKSDYASFTKMQFHKPLKDFSSGMKQRVKLITAFLTQCQLLILDEPLTNLDENGTKLYHYLWNHYSKGKIVIVASNRKEEYENCIHKLFISNQNIIIEN